MSTADASLLSDLILTNYFFVNFQQRSRRKREKAIKYSKLKQANTQLIQELDENDSSDEEQLFTSYSLNNYLTIQHRVVQVMHNLGTVQSASAG